MMSVRNYGSESASDFFKIPTKATAKGVPLTGSELSARVKLLTSRQLAKQADKATDSLAKEQLGVADIQKAPPGDISLYDDHQRSFNASVADPMAAS
jgi:hypothetical protein